MNKPRKAISEYERKYNRSRLAQWLKLPTWTAHEGVCLVCGIDPTGAEILWDGFKNAHGVHIDEPRIEKGQLLTEVPDETFSMTREQYIELASEEPSVNVWLSPEFFAAPPCIEIFEVEEERWATEKIFKPAWKRYVRNPEHAELNNRPPHEFIDWAVANDIDVRWLAWAQDRGYSAVGPIDSQHKTKESPAKKTPSAKAPEPSREKEEQIEELRKKAIEIAVKLRRMGLAPKHITIKRICDELLEESFSSGKAFTSRWRTVDGMRSYLKNEHHPKTSEEFRNAKSARGKFNT